MQPFPPNNVHPFHLNRMVLKRKERLEEPQRNMLVLTKYLVKFYKMNHRATRVITMIMVARLMSWMICGWACQLHLHVQRYSNLKSIFFFCNYIKLGRSKNIKLGLQVYDRQPQYVALSFLCELFSCNFMFTCWFPCPQ